MSKTLFYPGSFNPIGYHHLILGQMAMEAGGYDRIIFIPCFSAPHKTGLAPFLSRMDMCQLAAYRTENALASSMEQELYAANQRPSYTIETVRALKKAGHEEVHLLLGTDAFRKLQFWKDSEGFVSEGVHFVVAPRYRENDHLDYKDLEYHRRLKVRWDITLPLIGLSSTLIRDRVRNGKPVGNFTPKAVASYILGNGLYKKE